MLRAHARDTGHSRTRPAGLIRPRRHMVSMFGYLGPPDHRSPGNFWCDSPDIETAITAGGFSDRDGRLLLSLLSPIPDGGPASFRRRSDKNPRQVATLPRQCGRNSPRVERLRGGIPTRRSSEHFNGPSSLRPRKGSGVNMNKRGFASLVLSDPERHREIASQGGKACKVRTFSIDPELARKAGIKGGKAVPASKRTFSYNRDLAVSAGRKGGLSSSPRRRSFADDPELASRAGRKGGAATRDRRKLQSTVEETESEEI